MKTLVIGSGGREHALAWKLSQSPRVEKFFVAPGNDGMQDVAELVDIDKNNFQGLADFATENNITLTVPGPEDILCKGIVDYWTEQGLPDLGYNIFGPTVKAAELERSKVFAKEFMQRHDIPTADFKVFDNHGLAKSYIDEVGAPIVVKADGLAAGKGAIVCQTTKEADEAINLIMNEKAFGDAGNRVVIEKCLQGEELSMIALTDGKTIRNLLPSQDHKPIYDGDKGPNTGGMGAYAPAPIATEELIKKTYDQILIPTMKGMQEEGIRFTGCLYAGLMIDKNGNPKVLEFNVRFGDPETQAILLPLENHLVDLLEACTDGTLGLHEIRNQGTACCVVMAAPGYPGSYEKGIRISGLEKITDPDVVVFHAGTKRVKYSGINREGIVTTGGRVLGVTARGEDQWHAIIKAYENVGKIEFDIEGGAQYRRDIGRKAVQRRVA